MKMIGFLEKYDKIFVKLNYEGGLNEPVFIANQEEKKAIIQYLDTNDFILGKTWALYDDENYIGPYMIFSDGEWIWPNYYSYNIAKDNYIDANFLLSMRQKDFKVAPLTMEQEKDVTIFLEKKMLGIEG